MEEPAPNRKGLSSYRYPAISQVAILLASLLLFGVLIEFLQAARSLNPNIKIIGTVILCLTYVVLIIRLLSKPKGKQMKFITSAEALPGNYRYRRTWALVTGLYCGTFALSALVNGFLFLTLIFGSVFLLNYAAALFIKRGIRIDESGNIYLVRQYDEILIELNRAKEVSYIYSYAMKTANLTFRFDNELNTQLPEKIIIKASKLISEEYKTQLNQNVLAGFIREKCAALGFKITDVNRDMENFEWEASKAG